MVVLETLSGEIAAQQPVDSTGGFEIQDVPKATYLLSIKVKGFQPYERQINLSYGVGQYFVDIHLSPKPTVVRRSPPALTDEQAPRAARKELEKGQQALNKGNVRAAKRYLEAAVKDFPCYARAQTDLGLTLSTMHKYGPAEKALRKAIQCDPGFLESYTVLGQLLNAENRYSDSEVVLEEGLRLSPGSWQFYYELGMADFGQGKYELAAEQFHRAEGMTPPPPPGVHLKLADAYVKLASYDHAYREMAAYLRAAPHGTFAARAKQVMRQMKAAGVVHQSSAMKNVPPASPR
jgi:tetratricopeptide (TPR) repeat protein